MKRVDSAGSVSCQLLAIALLALAALGVGGGASVHGAPGANSCPDPSLRVRVERWPSTPVYSVPDMRDPNVYGEWALHIRFIVVNYTDGTSATHGSRDGGVDGREIVIGEDVYEVLLCKEYLFDITPTTSSTTTTVVSVIETPTTVVSVDETPTTVVSVDETPTTVVSVDETPTTVVSVEEPGAADLRGAPLIGRPAREQPESVAVDLLPEQRRLPETGLSTAQTALLALGLLMMGGGLVGIARRGHVTATGSR